MRRIRQMTEEHRSQLDLSLTVTFGPSKWADYVRDVRLPTCLKLVNPGRSSSLTDRFNVLNLPNSAISAAVLMPNVGFSLLTAVKVYASRSRNKFAEQNIAEARSFKGSTEPITVRSIGVFVEAVAGNSVHWGTTLKLTGL